MDGSTSNEGQRKRQLTGLDEFVNPPKNKTAKASLAKGKASPVVAYNQYESLFSEMLQAVTSKEPAATPKVKKVSAIMAKVKNIDTFVNK